MAYASGLAAVLLSSHSPYLPLHSIPLLVLPAYHTVDNGVVPSVTISWRYCKCATRTGENCAEGLPLLVSLQDRVSRATRRSEFERIFFRRPSRRGISVEEV